MPLRSYVKKLLGRACPRWMNYREYRRYRRLEFAKYLDKTVPEIEMLFVSDLVPGGGTVFDVGANRGAYSYILSASAKFSRVVAFEPFPELAEQLQLLLPKVDVRRMAISDQTTVRDFKVPFIRNKRYDTRGTLETAAEDNETDRMVTQVQAVTMDDFVSRNQIEDLQFIKIDVEGHELAAVAGGKNTLLRQRPMMLIEIERRHHPHRTINDIFSDILSLGYSGFFLEPESLQFRDVADFDAGHLQRLEAGMPIAPYVNNFIFCRTDELPEFRKRLSSIENRLQRERGTLLD